MSERQSVADEIRSRDTPTAEDGLVLTLLDLIAERDRLHAENETLSRAYGTLRRLVRDIENYALTPEPVLRAIKQALLRVAGETP